MESLTKQISIFILDDDIDFGNYIVTVLQQEKRIHVKFFSDEKLFLASYHKSIPDLAMVDLQFGEKKEMGFEMIALLKDQYPDNAVWMISSESQKVKILHALDLGADDYLPKPVDESFLLAKVFEFSAQKEKNKSQGLALATFRVPKTERLIDCYLSLKIIGIHEKGVFIQSPHYISRGALVKLSSSFLSSALRSTSEFLFTVEDVDFVSGGTFRIKLTFENIDEAMTRLFRDYLRKEYLLKRQVQT